MRSGLASRRVPAHPRACGENAHSTRSWGHLEGSSPRVRGKRAPRTPRPVEKRLIPARAGKTGGFRAWARARAGSSPRVRGKQRFGVHRVLHVRLIPARAGKTSSASARTWRQPAHPRACGENRAGDLTPPHPQWLIPARAGKTRSLWPSAAGEEAHPRACGENDVKSAPRMSPRGSSPRVRGKRSRPRGARPCRGLIPARAGKTLRVHGRQEVARAHPRACGENVPVAGLGYPCQGSSPRVRGKPLSHDGAHEDGRLIPARAGKTARAACGTPASRAHPRACGENQKPPSERNCSLGSSPRVRGKLQGRRHRKPPERLIPARAGKTGPRSPQRGPPAAHPRACGENLSGIGSTLNTWGSSPRVRGKRAELHSLLHELGLIPARAGKTSATLTHQTTPTAHPRACGENPTVGTGRPSTRGSSPRVRGKQSRGVAGHPCPGLIPARAGKT